MTADEKTMTVLRFLTKHGQMVDFLQEDDDGHLAVLLNCNDLFAWASADAEEITIEDLPDYERAINDCGEVQNSYQAYAGSLWACRKRVLRPQLPVLAKLPEKLRLLFEAVSEHTEQGC